jgi:hypothetical protein
MIVRRELLAGGSLPFRELSVLVGSPRLLGKVDRRGGDVREGT